LTDYALFIKPGLQRNLFYFVDYCAFLLLIIQGAVGSGIKTKRIRSMNHTVFALPTAHTTNIRSNGEMSLPYRVIDPSPFVRGSASPGLERRDISLLYAVTLKGWSSTRP